MKKTVYNAQLGVPSGWLALPEAERLQLALDHHATLPPGHPRTSNLRVHAAMHVVVENQLAAASPREVIEALERLRAEGLDRHDAIHALGSVAIELVRSALQKEKAEGDPMTRLRAGYAALSAEKWRASLEEEG